MIEQIEEVLIEEHDPSQCTCELPIEEEELEGLLNYFLNY